MGNDTGKKGGGNIIMPRFGRRQFLGAAGAAAVTPFIVSPKSASAAGWPERAITTVVMYGAGGGTDTVLRTIAAEMVKNTGWDINVINKPGAVGGVATNFMLGKPADGYWWLGAANYNKFVRVMGHSDSVAWEDWQYFQGGNSLAAWSVRPESPYQTVEDVFEDARKRPGQISISTSGTGGIWHELAAIVSEAAEINLKFVPYKGGKPATLAGLQGEVDIAGGGVHEHIEHVRAGNLRMLQQTGAKGVGKLRSIGDAIPDLKPLLPLGGIYNLALKRDTPVEILKQIAVSWEKAFQSDAWNAVAKQKFFETDVRIGEAADRRAAQVECLTADTFTRIQEHIGKPVRGTAELGLPNPKEFDTWWPPKGYKPRMA